MRALNVLKCAYVAASVLVLSSASFGSGSDDSVWINAGIQAALKKGQTSYTIPAGSYVLQNPIVVPPGVKTFTLQGAGSAYTHFTASAKLLSYPGYAILVGQQVQLNNWELTNVEPGVSIASVSTGDKSVKLLSNNVKFSAGEYAVILDANQVYTSAPGVNQGQLNRAELTKITAVNSSASTVTLDQPAAREYTDSPMIYPCSDIVSTNVTVKGMSFDGTVANSSVFNNGIVNAALTDYLYLTDLVVTNFQDRAIQTDIVRNGLFNELNITNGQNIQNEGSGYGLTMCRSRFITVENSSANVTRHSFVGTNGSTDITFQKDTAVVMPTGLNDFNTHGFDERRMHYISCNGTLTFGNPSWLGGCQGFTVQNCTSTQAVWIGPNARNITLTSSTLGPIDFVSVIGGHGTPSSGYADAISFQSCNIMGIWGIGKALVQMGSATFQNCYFENTTTSWGASVMTPANCIGQLTFTNCTLQNDSAASPVILNEAPQLYVNMSNCKLVSKLGALSGFNLQSGLMNVNASNNVFVAPKPKNGSLTFIDVPANANLKGSNNSCQTSS
jgi:hypothetical protein